MSRFKKITLAVIILLCIVGYRIYRNDFKKIKNYDNIYPFSEYVAAKRKEELSKDSKILMPKIIHRVWFSWDPQKPEMSDLYKYYDKKLKEIHSDWKFEEWNEERCLNLVKEKYPEFLDTYLGYKAPVQRHDAVRYLILDQYGGFFIQHSFNFRKSINDIVGGVELVFSAQARNENSVGNNFFGGVAGHPIWTIIKQDLIVNSDRRTIDSTGPYILSRNIYRYYIIDPNVSMRILDNKYLIPFDWVDRYKKKIVSDICLKGSDDCFNFYPDSYAYTLWSGSWYDQEMKNSSLKKKLFNVFEKK